MKHKYKILIAEDDLENGAAALATMEKLGFCGVIVENAEDAIKLLDKEEFLAVLTDMNMPLRARDNLPDKKAGKSVIKECINRRIPSAVITGGIGHHGDSCIKILLPEPMFAVKHVEKFSFNTKEISGTDKNIEVWKKTWSVLKKQVDYRMFYSRRRYRYYTGKPFKR